MDIGQRRILWMIAIAVLTLGLAACAPLPEHPTTFLFKMEAPNVEAAKDQLILQLQGGLTTVGLPTGYPRRGTIAEVNVEGDPPVVQSRCQADATAGSGEACLALNGAGDYLRVQSVTWESEAFHMYRIYVIPDEVFVTFDPVTDYVAVDVILQSDSIAWEPIQAGIELAAQELGARPIPN